MYVGLKEFTGAINKITDIVAGDKTVPGVLLRLSKNDNDETEGTLSVCYSSGHKAMIEELVVQLEETDFIGDAVTLYEQIVPAVSSCQPHGKVEVDTLRIEYFPEILKLSVEQYVSYSDATGESTIREKMGTKYIDISRVKIEDNPKAKVLVRQKYEDIFSHEQLDEYNRDELIDILNRTAIEKGRLIYFSNKHQEVQVANQAHAVAYKIEGYELGEDDKQLIRQELAESGITSEEDFNNVCKERIDRIHYTFIIHQQMAKAVANILSKAVSDTVYIYRADDFSYILIDNEDEKIGIVYESPKGSKLHLECVGNYTSLGYKTYQLTFLKDFIEDAIKQALNTTKSEKVQLQIQTEFNEETGNTEYYMVVQGGSGSASTSNMNRFKADDIVDTVGDLAQLKLDVALKVLIDMLTQLRTDVIAFDIDVSNTGSTKIRVAEIDTKKRAEQYQIMRAGLSDDTPTPIERKIESRDKILGFRTFTLLNK